MSTKEKTVCFFLPLGGERLKSATGAKQIGVGVGVGNGVGVGVGATEPLGSGVGVGVGAGVGVGVGIGVAVGVAVGAATFGRTAIWAAAVWTNVRLWPPVNADRIGVNREKWPTTLTATSLPRASTQGDGVHVSETSDGAIVRNDPLDSVRTAQTTRLVEVLHG